MTASNGKIIFTPGNADGVGVFDPSDNSFALVDISSTISTDSKFLGRDCEQRQDHLCPLTRTVWECSIRATTASLWWASARPFQTGKFDEPATASNGKIIFTPYNADGVGV